MKNFEILYDKKTRRRRSGRKKLIWFKLISLMYMQALVCARDYPYYIGISFVFGSLLVYMFGSFYNLNI
nr:MAG TPA: hypothetical protein [Caudoviricetes sp.]